MAQELDALLSGLVSDPDGRPITYSPAAGKSPISVSEIAREFGITPRALRFYERKGLLSAPRQGVARVYGQAERERLTLVLKAKHLGFTLDEIGRMLAGPAGSSDAGVLCMSRRQCLEQIKLLEGRKREIEAALAELRRIYSSFYVRLAASAG